MSGDFGTESVAPEGSVEFGPPSATPAALHHPSCDCPACGGRVDLTDSTYFDRACPHCGQAMDFSKVTELFAARPPYPW